MRDGFAVMPSTQRCLNTVHPLVSIEMLPSRRDAITGSKTLRCNCPASAASVTVMSLPITSKQIWFTTSGMTGLTLPGMIDDPGCIGGKLISPNPARGPELNKRRSLQIFDSLTEHRLSTPESWTNAPVSAVASTKSGPVISDSPVIRDSSRHTVSAYPAGAYHRAVADHGPR